MRGRSIRRLIRAQRGAAFLLSLLVLALIGVSVFVTLTSGSDAQLERDGVTAAALAQAKTALVGYAAGVALTGTERLGDLPCPDRDNDGNADPPCATEATSLGRLPWRTLGLPDVRDGAGERLWYAVSARFRNNPRLACTDAADANCLNSDSSGTITVRMPDATILMDGSNPFSPHPRYPAPPSGAIAVVIAPGDVLVRSGAASPQVRQCSAGTDCDTTGRCTTANPVDTPTCNPTNYLDVYPSPPASVAEDNADFQEASSGNGFIMGPIVQDGRVVVNDRIATIAYADLMPLLERRVVREVGVCLDQYAATNNGRYPWAADSTNAAVSNDYSDVADLRAGRIPSDNLNATRASSTNTMSASWPGAPCTLMQAWWRHWQLQVYYAVADFYKPGPSPVTGPCGSCLTILTQATPVQARYVVIAAGRRLKAPSTQLRDSLPVRANPANYLEEENNYVAPLDTPDVFRARGAVVPFNDVVHYK